MILIQKKTLSSVLPGVSSTVEYQTAELERELEKVKSKKTNLGNFYFLLFRVDCGLVGDLYQVTATS